MASKTPKIRWFYYHGVFHKALHISRGADTISAWNFAEHKPKTYVYSDVRRNGQKAYNIHEISKLLNRSELSIRVAIRDGKIQRPDQAYTIDERRRPLNYWWSPDDILAAHDYYVNVHQGRPRADGKITSGGGLPTRAELKAMLRGDPATYVKDGEGNFVPTWQSNKM